MRQVRDIIIARTKKLKLDAADLCKLVDGKVNRQTIYNLLNAGGELNTRTLGPIMDALDLHIVAGDEVDLDSKRDSKTRVRTARKRKQT
jgi:hypothetical protein